MMTFRPTPLGVALLVAAAWLFGAADAVQANRFGPPWQAHVTAETAVVYSQPDRAAPPVGPVSRGQIMAVLGELKGADGADWTSTADGFIPSSALDELRQAWVAEVVAPTASVHAKSDARSPIRRTAARGSLLRVTGMSPGLEGDTNVWWATTEGYVGLRAIRPATGEWAGGWTVPDGTEAGGGWWGTVRSTANLRAGPTTAAPPVGGFGGGERVKVLAEEQGQAVGGNPVWYRIDGGRYAGARIHSSLVSHLPGPKPNLAAPPPDTPPGPWIVIDRASATLTYVADGQARFATYVSLGRAGVETPAGPYSTFGKYRADDMTSASVPDAEHAYDFPNVPFTQYYRLGGYALHGTYWHDNFGLVQSQGCINLTWTDAAYLFGLTRPGVDPADNARWSPAEQATPVVIVN